MLKVQVKDASGFKKGMGIQLSDDEHNQGWDVTTAIITDIKDNVIYFDNPTVNDYIAELEWNYYEWLLNNRSRWGCKC